MPNELHLVLAFVLAAVAALAVTPVAIAVATRTGFHDKPVGYKGHAAPTPYLGGAAVVVAFVAGGLTLGGELSRLAPIVVAAFGFWCLGTTDDKLNLNPVLRLGVEFAVAAALFATGLGWDVFGSPVPDLMLTCVWLVGLMNAFNLMDNMDGAAATVAAVTSGATAVLAAAAGDPELAALCLCLTGALVGFLPYNLAGPARIFLGDGGSLPVGFVVAATIMAVPDATEVGWTLPLAAVVLAGLPVVDTTLVMVSRRRAGVPLLTGGRDHMTHRLAGRLRSPRRVAGVLGLVQAVLGAVAVGVVEIGAGSVVTAWVLWFVAATVAIAVLESRAWAPARAAAVGEAALPASDEPPARPARTPTAVEAGAILFITVACGLSPALFGFYRVTVWGPIALGMLAILLAMAIARPAVPSRRAWVALAGLGGLWLWSLLSTTWAESADSALTGANRWLLYLALFGVLVMLLREDRLAVLLVGAGGAVVLAFGVYLTVRLLGPGASGLFLGARLNEPLGYVNGQAGYLLMGVWPCIALAETTRHHAVAGLAVASGALLAGLALLGETRAIVPAALLSALVLIVLTPGRPRRAWTLVAIAAGVVFAGTALIDVYDTGSAARNPPAGVIHDGVTRLLLGAVLAGAVYGAVSWLGALVGRRTAPGRIGRVSGAVAVLLAVVLVVAGVAAVGDPAGKAREQWDAFRNLDSKSTAEARSRFASGGGNRYDYWRVAWGQFGDNPLKGEGAGNFDRTWFAQRRVTEDVRQAHSIELQTLGELGLVGGVLLLAFVGAVLSGLAARSRQARGDPRARALGVAGGGMFLVWLIHTSVDWLHLIPGVTGIALCGAAVLVAPWRPRSPEGGSPVRGLRVFAVGAVVIVALVGGVLVGRAALAQRDLGAARSALGANPSEAIARTTDSLAFDDEHVPAYYVRAAAFARLNDYKRARGTLLAAVAREPHDFVTWALLGDLAVRRGDFGAARRAYGRAARLNPRQVVLRDLARDPREALPAQ